MYGNRVIIDGLEACARFRATTSLLRRPAVAGLFNSGTNFMTQLIRRNCIMPLSCPSKDEAHGTRPQKSCIGFPYQVPYGKHNPVRTIVSQSPFVTMQCCVQPDWRYGNHTVPSLAHYNRSEVLPVVVIKDALSWMRSMCRYSYAARFRRSRECPSPLNPNQDPEGGSVTVAFRKDVRQAKLTPGIVTYNSLLDMWSSWYEAYWTQPDRLIVRYEDLLFNTEETVREICQCVGGRIVHGSFDHVLAPAKSGIGHGGSEQTDRAKALEKYGLEANRYHGLTESDLRYYVQNAQPDLVSKFHYFASLERHGILGTTLPNRGN